MTLAGGANVFVVTENATNSSAPVTVYFLPAAPTLQVAAISAPTVAVSGNGQPGALINILTNGVLAANFTNNAAGHYAGSITLPANIYSMSATETINGLTSLPSAATTLTVSTVLPIIDPQPHSVNGLLGEKVTFSAGVSGAKPLHISWEKNGVKIPGATTTNLTLASLGVNSQASYVMIATNKYGSATSAYAAVLTLVPNPFPGLTGTYYGLFAESNAQFASSGF